MSSSSSNNPLTQSDDLQQPNEREVLMARARLMGITISNNIGLDTLRERINAHIAGNAQSQEQEQEDDASSSNQEAQEASEPLAPIEPVKPTSSRINPLEDEIETNKNLTPRQRMLAEQMRLVRIRVTCMDPKKKDLQGEVLTVANRVIGTVRKFVPFGAATENGYHVPYCLYNMLKDREFLQVRSFMDPVTRQLRQETKYIKEFAIEVLEPLTKEELKRLAISQMSAGGNDPS